MRKISRAVGAALLALAATISHAGAAPLKPPPKTAVIAGNDMTEVYFRRGFYAAGGFYYFNGYRGYVRFRPGFRYYNGYWFPAGAFAAGVALGAAVADPYPAAPGPRLAVAHIRWCYAHFATYRVSDNSYQPYVGPRRQCWSPYS